MIVLIFAIAIIGCTVTPEDSKVKNIEITPTPTHKDTIPTPTNSTTSAAASINESNYKFGDIVDIAKPELTNSIFIVEDRFMDADGHIYEIFNRSDDATDSIVIHLNKQFSTLKYSIYNKALLTTDSGSDGTSVISEATNDGKPIGDPILSTAVKKDELYPISIEVEVSELDHVVIIDLQNNLHEYNFVAIAK